MEALSWSVLAQIPEYILSSRATQSEKGKNWIRRLSIVSLKNFNQEIFHEYFEKKDLSFKMRISVACNLCNTW